MSVNTSKRDPSSNLKPGQKATLFPSLGYYDLNRRAWRAWVHGRVFREGKVPIGTRILLRGLKRAMKLTPEELAGDIFQKRVDGFLAAPGGRRRIVLEIAGHRFRLTRRTRRNGTFYGTLTLPHEAIEPSLAAAARNRVQMDLTCSSVTSGPVAASGTIHLVPPEGLSVISDIDDTIKLTEATSRKQMLTNTFLKPFEAVAGMSELYRRWHAQGCEFHYVSSSPWQLYDELSELCSAANFPAGSMHLRYFRMRDEMFKRFRPVRRNVKVGIIAGILKRLPDRRFVLIGDSGEKDPEIYRFLARRFPKQIDTILIRNLQSRPLAADRFRKLETLPPATTLHIFQEPREISDMLW